ncbi:MAG TPA: SLC13 family permease [Brevefilum sp.]|nr:SLC13 family permease [Brevefilum sp.]HOR18934.1 SLC13 family permease [Brevefilum sp.]HPL69387.1 SLC13 family permease [Brevefilum sp.]
MTLHMVLLIIIILAALVLFSIEFLPADVIALGLMMTLILTGILPAKTAFAGFGSDTSLMILGILILTAALVHTGIVQILSQKIIQSVGEDKKRLFWIISGAAGIISSFISNTATAAFFTPMTIGLSRRLKINPSKMLMPMAFATILASSVTLVATSTNVVVSGQLTQYGLPPLGMFEMTAVGVPILIVGLLYMYFIGQHLIPIRETKSLDPQQEILSYLSEIKVTPDSPWAGRSLQEIGLGKEYDLYALRILKESGIHVEPRSYTILHPGDRVLVEGNKTDLMTLREKNLVAFTGEFDPQSDISKNLSLAEVILLPGSPLIGRTLRGLNFRDRFGLQVLGINRKGETIRRRISLTRLQVGDQLLLQGNPETIQGLGKNTSFRVITGELEAMPETRKAPLALAIFGGVILLVSVNLLTLPVGVMLGALTAFITRCITPEEAYRQVNWSAWLLIACMLSLGRAMEVTGLATLLANQIAALIGASHPLLLLSTFFFLSMLLTQPMSNQAAAVIVTPIAMQAATHLNLNPRAFAIMIAIGASNSFITPLEPACLMVYGPGNYRFFDFLKVGAMLTVLIFGIAILMVPSLWPL